MVYKFGPNDQCLRRCRAMVPVILRAAEEVTAQGRVSPGEWVAVHGCGGVGLSAVMIAAAAGARVVAVDRSPGALDLARRFGAVACVDAAHTADTAETVRELTGGGAHVSLDALGAATTCAASVGRLRRRGRHVQVGLLPAPCRCRWTG